MKYSDNNNFNPCSFSIPEEYPIFFSGIDDKDLFCCPKDAIPSKDSTTAIFIILILASAVLLIIGIAYYFMS